ncbi:MAG: dihydroorotase [Maricaulis sp.]|uniref:dihydroorotase n=1 Tax=Maricaulis sp. TaxID=1486257 RepID=UPI001B2B188B|nr:dihydroorotase [Maricaulis sp.]MBO6729551.1 dihydroorotase [Maricaulis sp.]MBO6847488.1 dihydroorotase [Maricaulis sp.]MBO6877058.1 dihydroorotase [Maricaulis sp.]
MSQTFDLLLKGGEVVNHSGRGRADVGIIDGKTVEIGDLSQASAGEVIDCTGLTVLPGVIDSQVHFREPGMEWKEDLQSGSLCAVLGGVTAVFEMPNTEPTTTSPDMLIDKLNRAKDRMHCDHAFYAGATNENTGVLGEMERMLGCCGVKVFMGASTGSLLVQDDEGVERVLNSIQRRAAFHSEDEYRLAERRGLAVEGDWTSHPVVRDPEAAMMSTKRLVRLARKTGKRIHVLHISTAEEMEFLAQHRDIASVEATPQHLTLEAPGIYEEIRGRAQMNPPVREAHHIAGLWRGLQRGVVDVIGSDHAPHTLEEKAKPYPQSPSGMPGVQTLVPIMLDHVNAGRLTLERFVDLTSHGVQRIFGLSGKGRMAAGWDADFTIVDMNHSREITDDWSASKSGWTPFHGRTVKGWPMMTIVRGKMVMRDDELVGHGLGEPVKFLEALPKQ